MRFSRLLGSALASGLLLLPSLGYAQAPGAAEPAAQALRPGQSVERTLPTGAVHTYTVDEPVGGYLRAEVEEPPSSFYFRVFDPAGVQLSDAWASCDREGPCGLRFFTEVEGPYRVELRSLAADFPAYAADAPEGAYRLRLEAAAPDEAAVERERLQSALAWLADHARPLESVDAGSGFEDLLPLKEALAEARVVGLGEATHGSREFFQVKHRMIEFLVLEMGFTLFGIELDQGAAKAINDFVLHGVGDHVEALAAQGMWQWDTEEVAALIDWMREYNRSAPEKQKVRFAGFDFQINDRGRDEVVDYLQRVAPEQVAATDSLLAPLVRRTDPTRRALVEFYSLSPEQKAETAAGISELFDFLAASRSRFVAHTSEAEFEEVLQSARRLVQFSDAHSRPGYEQDEPESGVATRDRYMAENVERLLDEAGPGVKMVLWSHNTHIQRDAYNMGYYLGQRYGGAYYAFGLAFDWGGFRALEITGKSPAPLKEFELPPALQESVGWYLRRAGKGDVFVDFRQLPVVGPAAEWLGRPHTMRSIGNGYAPTNPSGYYRAPVVLRESYDGVIFIEQTTPARGNPQPVP